MRIRILQEFLGSPNGIRVIKYLENDVLHVPSEECDESLAKVMLELGVAEVIKKAKAKEAEAEEVRA